MRQDAVVIPTVAGQQYVVSMFGTISDWVHNLEAADGAAVISHGGSVRVRLVKVASDERAPILREYVRVASSGRKHFRYRCEHRWPSSPRLPRSTLCIESSGLPDDYRVESHLTTPLKRLRHLARASPGKSPQVIGRH